jgi:hypothetical protein
MKIPGRAGTWIIVGFLLFLLLLAAIVLFAGWDSYGDESVGMTSAGYVAMAFGVIVTLGLGIGLMSLVYI